MAPETTSTARLHLGIDVGSTTVKVAVLDNNQQIVYSVYRRHHADVRATVLEVLREAAEQFPDQPITTVAKPRICAGSYSF